MSNPLRVAIIGAGTIARRQHVPDLRTAGADVVVHVSRSLESARAARDEAGHGDITTDWQSVVRRSDVDAVVVATPSALHAPVAIAAAAAGKHVLVEKPFATTLADADQMIAASAAAGVILMAAHNVRFAAPFGPMRASILRGDIGTPTSARVAFCHAGPQAWAPGATWFRDPALAGGGALFDLGVHVVDTLRHVLDDELVEVTATLDATPIDEDAAVTFRTRGGVVGSFHAGWRSAAGADLSMIVHGDQATLAFDAATGLTLRRPGAAPQALALDGPTDNPCAAFVRAIGRGEPTTPSGADGRAAVAAIVAAYLSARTGRTQTVEQQP